MSIGKPFTCHQVLNVLTQCSCYKYYDLLKTKFFHLFDRFLIIGKNHLILFMFFKLNNSNCFDNIQACIYIYRTLSVLYSEFIRLSETNGNFGLFPTSHVSYKWQPGLNFNTDLLPYPKIVDFYMVSICSVLVSQVG